MQNDVLIDFLKKRKDRSIAILLSFKDNELDRQIDARTSQKFRKLVMDQLNEFYNTSLDVIDSLDTGEYVLNQSYLDRMAAMHDKIDKMYDKVVADGERT